ncbi:MAG: purine-nucleoside phosphorylase, partial [Planctomycetota bacterium]|nr:purine-nucleoside phosphorylase [Planctomycetota bacterium]
MKSEWGGLVVEGILDVQINPVLATADFVRAAWRTRPKLALILGTGMGEIADDIEIQSAFAYESIPNFQRSTAIGHRGRLLCGRLRGVPVVAMDGRFHVYEGYSQAEVSFSVRVMSELGAGILFVSNAAGALNPYYHVGDLLVIDDHINLLANSGGIESQIARAVVPHSRRLYDSQLAELAISFAKDQSVRVHRGVYIAVPGPNYETPAESRYLRRIGGDAVGMSTAPEVTVAADCGMRTFG